eukprot:5639512-Pyramimonas_sp.AAC.1
MSPECSFGYRGRPLGGLLEAGLKSRGGRLGAPWSLVWGLFGASCCILGASLGGRLEFTVRVLPLGVFLKPSLGASEA